MSRATTLDFITDEKGNYDDEKNEAIISQQAQDIFAAATRVNDFFTAMTSKTEITLATTKLDRLKQVIQEFKNLKQGILYHNNIVKDSQTNGIAYSKTENNLEDIYDNCQNLYFKLQNKQPASTGAPAVAPAQSGIASPAPSVIQVSAPFKPNVEIPKFNGKTKEWNSFFTLYKSVIHDSTKLTDVQKFQFMRSYLTGDALKLIDYYDLSAVNYTPAYTALVDRYSNPRILANAHLNNLLIFAPMPNTYHSSVQHYLNVHQDSINAYKKLTIRDPYDYILFQISYQHLHKYLQTEFDKKFPVNTFPKYADLMHFVEGYLQAKELHSDDIETRPSNRSSRPQSERATHVLQISAENYRKPKCIVCSQEHLLYKCPKFQSLTPTERFQQIKGKNICYNCFGNHTRDCPSSKRCRKCSGRHHTLIHKEDGGPRVNACIATESARTENGRAEAPDTLVCNMLRFSEEAIETARTYHLRGSSSALLGTAIIYVQDKNNNFIPMRTMLDCGSQAQLMTKSFAQKWGFQITPISTNLKGISNISPSIAGGVKLTLFSSSKGKNPLSATAIVTDKITDELPSSPISITVASRFSKFKLADPFFYRPDEIDFLLGVELYTQILLSKPPIKGIPTGIHTIYGLVIMGSIPASHSNTIRNHAVTFDTLEAALKKFWEHETVESNTIQNPEDMLCEELFKKTTTRDSTGRYTVALPFRDTPNQLGNNRSLALQRLYGMERRFLKNAELYNEYSDFIHEYTTLRHMALARSVSNYVIPHHAVFKQSTTTKLRVVFDASAKSADSGKSLNDILCKGPKLQNNITIILSRFRLFKVALCADLAKMYRQILVRPEDRQYQHIFWRNNKDERVQEFELSTVTYGLAPSAFLAQRVLKQLIKDEGNKFPTAASILDNNTYVDDLVGGASSDDEAIELYHELGALLGQGGFFPRKWASSSHQVLEAIPSEHRETPLTIASNDALYNAIKVLGLQWSSQLDSFLYQVKEFTGPASKRNILSYIATMYDPLGWLAPFIFQCKLFMQQLWKEGITWDEPLKPTLEASWNAIIKDVAVFSQLQIPRRILPDHPVNKLQVIGFCDASAKGHACALYLRYVTNQAINMHLIAAKSKVAPLKNNKRLDSKDIIENTIPKFELEGAHLLIKVIKSFQPFFSSLPQHETHCFTDSTIVLSWLSTPLYKLKPYVANRVDYIINEISPDNWHHVPSEQNSADPPSRGLNPSELSNSRIWWQGPLEFSSTNFNIARAEPSPQVNLIPELKCHIARFSNDDTSINDLVIKFSSLTKLNRVIAYVQRFYKNCKQKSKGLQKTTGPLMGEELKTALNCIINSTQDHYWAKEKKKVKKNIFVPEFKALAPFVTTDNLMRAGGRLQNAPLPYNSKHPILIPGKSHLAKLLCDNAHKATLHGGTQLIMAFLRQTYWIPSIKRLIKSCMFRCTICVRARAKTMQPTMAGLPAIRFSQIRAFKNVGLDFAGPFYVKEIRRRGRVVPLKGYVALFICLSVKAIHLEFVSDLSTPAFMAALHRFVARRGAPSKLLSDNGTNFVGADNEMERIHEILASEKLTSFLSEKRIEWDFNPPSAPHFGGIWEANIKSMKKHLYKTIGASILSLEEFQTILCRVEAILNSRPLYAVTDDVNDHIYLSPAHFLIGEPFLAIPEPSYEGVKYCDRWQLISQSVQHFWRVWKSSYLQSLLPKSKWQQAESSIKVNDIVLIKKSKTPPLIWPIARVIETFPGSGGQIRVVKLRLADTILVRPVHKLVKLPIEEIENESKIKVE